MTFKRFPSMLAWALVNAMALLGAFAMTYPLPGRAQSERPYTLARSEWNVASSWQAQEDTQADASQRAPMRDVQAG